MKAWKVVRMLWPGLLGFRPCALRRWQRSPKTWANSGTLGVLIWPHIVPPFHLVERAHVSGRRGLRRQPSTPTTRGYSANSHLVRAFGYIFDAVLSTDLTCGPLATWTFLPREPRLSAGGQCLDVGLRQLTCTAEGQGGIAGVCGLSGIRRCRFGGLEILAGLP